MKRVVFIGISVVAALAAGLLLWREDSLKRVLPDGTTFILSGVRVAPTNIYTHGSMLSRLLGGAIPSNGITFAGFKVRRSRQIAVRFLQGRDSLAAEVRLAPGSPQETSLLSPPFVRKYRLLIYGDDGHPFVNEFNGFYRFDDGLFAHVGADVFPRDSKSLHFRLEERKRSDTRDWRELATFVVQNPKVARVEPWQPDRSLQFDLPDDRQLEIGPLVVRSDPIHPTDIWEHTASLSIRIARHGQGVTNWGILGGNIYDASGNASIFAASKIVTNGWMVYRMHRPLNPAKLWKFNLRLGCDSDFPASNLLSFVVPFPLPAPLRTNLGVFPTDVKFHNSSTLSVQLANKPAGIRLSFVSAADEMGNDLDDGTGSWGQHSFWRNLKLQSWKRLGLNQPTEVRAMVAIRPEHEVEFTIQPR